MSRVSQAKAIRYWDKTISMEAALEFIAQHHAAIKEAAKAAGWTRPQAAVFYYRKINKLL